MEVVFNADGSCSVLRDFRCPEQVTKIAINYDDSIAYICCGAQNLYKVNLKDFKLEEEMIENLTGICHNMIIDKIGDKVAPETCKKPDETTHELDEGDLPLKSKRGAAFKKK